MALVLRGKETSIGVGGAEAYPRRIREAEAAADPAEAAASAIRPLSDPHYSAAYRRDVVRAAVRRALEQCN
jgi:CO/xanthine dehydrogenase FAD-binding subunit